MEPSGSPIRGSCSFQGLRRTKCVLEEAYGGPWREAGSCEMTESVVMSKQ